MNLHSKAKLVDLLQSWLDDEQVADDLGGTDGIWQCSNSRRRNATLLADACEIVLRSAALQNELEQEISMNGKVSCQ